MTQPIILIYIFKLIRFGLIIWLEMISVVSSAGDEGRAIRHERLLLVGERVKVPWPLSMW